ncbi:zinc-dependent peptidase [Fulvivirgaceae bacterium BMA10]|uniref:Zinc-dependent peptidase n=1 Tax=Splendidivirga corallicola TaxID=3051826 RepID=A0ABT8KMQ4_9BACT|nr:zinc-dependent peptidase [Fulvivirgaceae bacterium BMA10]
MIPITISLLRNPRFFVRSEKKYKVILEAYFLYYQKLPSKEKKQFEKRVNRFIKLKQFIPRNIDSVSDEMKTLIAASAIQLTFGLPEIYFTHFNKIIIYPDSYYSSISRMRHKGEVNSRWGIIVLSWNSFLEGYAHSTSATNLGLHEMAHALNLENRILNGEYGFLDMDLLKAWREESRKIMFSIRSGENKFFRKYGGENEEEFFAVAVESFFERPKEFKREHPKLYTALSKLLNQDPVEILTYEPDLNS